MGRKTVWIVKADKMVEKKSRMKRKFPDPRCENACVKHLLRTRQDSDVGETKVIVCLHSALQEFTACHISGTSWAILPCSFFRGHFFSTGGAKRS